MGLSADEQNRTPHQQNHHLYGGGDPADAKGSDVPDLIIRPAPGGHPGVGVGTIVGIGGEERIGTVIGICAWSDSDHDHDHDRRASVEEDQDRHRRRGGVVPGTRASAPVDSEHTTTPTTTAPTPTATAPTTAPAYSPGSARVIRWDDDGSVETVRWDVDAGVFDVTHVKIKNHRIATRFAHPLTRSQRLAARYFGQDVQYGVILRLRQQPLLPEDQAQPIVKRFVGLMEWPDFSGVVAVDGTGGPCIHTHTPTHPQPTRSYSTLTQP